MSVRVLVYVCGGGGLKGRCGGGRPVRYGLGHRGLYDRSERAPALNVTVVARTQVHHPTKVRWPKSGDQRDEMLVDSTEG